MLARWARLVGINLAVLLVGVVIIELAFGNWIFGPHLGYLTIARDVALRYDLNPVDPGAGIGTYTRDEYGLRGDYGGDPANIDVLVMGGSTTNELYVSDEKTWVAQLDKLLRNGGYDLEAVNAGVDGHSSIAHIRSFDVWLPQIPRLHPKYILFYIGINEPAADAIEGLEMFEAKDFWSKVVQTFENNSAIHALYRTVRGYVRAREVRLVHQRVDLASERMVVTWDNDPKRVRTLKATWQARLDAYEARAHRLVALTRGRGAQPVFVTQVRGDYRWHGDELIAINNGTIERALVLRLFNAVTLKVCHDEKMICVDLEHRLKVEDGDFYDFVHMVSSGSRKVAQVIYDGLVPYLPKPP
jgi:hypothetical protein